MDYQALLVIHMEVSCSLFVLIRVNLKAKKCCFSIVLWERFNLHDLGFHFLRWTPRGCAFHWIQWADLFRSTFRSCFINPQSENGRTLSHWKETTNPIGNVLTACSMAANGQRARSTIQSSGSDAGLIALLTSFRRRPVPTDGWRIRKNASAAYRSRVDRSCLRGGASVRSHQEEIAALIFVYKDNLSSWNVDLRSGRVGRGSPTPYVSSVPRKNRAPPLENDAHYFLSLWRSRAPHRNRYRHGYRQSISPTRVCVLRHTIRFRDDSNDASCTCVIRLINHEASLTFSHLFNMWSPTC